MRMMRREGYSPVVRSSAGPGVSMGRSIPARSGPTHHSVRAPRTRSGSMTAWQIVAIQGFLEWFFAGLLASLVGIVTLFAAYVALQLFRNPGRGSGTRP